MGLPNIGQPFTPFAERDARSFYIFKRVLLMRYVCVAKSVDLLDLFDEFFRRDCRESLLNRLENSAKGLARRLCVMQRPS